MRKALYTVLVSTFTGISILAVPSAAISGVKNVSNARITMKAGHRAGLQYLYAWDEACRPVNVRVRTLDSGDGRLFTVMGRFKITGKQSAKCAGRYVPGKKVVFKANRNFQGNTVVKYRISSRNTADDIVVTRPIRVRK